MAIISQADLLTYCDHLGAIWDWLRGRVGSSADAGSPVKGTAHWFAEQLKSHVVVDLDDFEQETDLLSGVGDAADNMVIQQVVGGLANSMTALDNHCGGRGPALNSSIVNLSTYITHLNSTPYTVQLTPGFMDLWRNLGLTAIPQDGAMKRTYHPDWAIEALGTVDGMGSCDHTNTFTDGVAVDQTIEAECTPIAEVITSFAGGAAAPAVNVAGTDNDGNSINWTGTFSGNNPTAALSTTITPAVTQFTRSTVAVASASGIVNGSILKVNAGLDDEETILVENVSGSDITAVFLLAHDAGATLTGGESLALTPSVGGQLLRDVTNITLTLSSHSAGKIRILNTQSRSSL